MDITVIEMLILLESQIWGTITFFFSNYPQVIVHYILALRAKFNFLQCLGWFCTEQKQELIFFTIND